MSFKTKIEWTEATWNPITGCDKISSGCKNCYARRFAERFRGIRGHHFEQGFDLRLWPERLNHLLTWKKPRMVFVNSMADLFHEKVPEKFIKDVFEVMAKADRHIFQVLTKRSQQLVKLAPKLPWPPNVWMGVTVESPKYCNRISHLKRVESAVRFVSMEPLLSEMGNIDLEGIDWIIVGGESGPGARLMRSEWVREIRDQCIRKKVPFFFKQWGGVNKKKTGRILDGRTWDEMPIYNKGIIGKSVNKKGRS